MKPSVRIAHHRRRLLGTLLPRAARVTPRVRGRRTGVPRARHAGPAPRGTAQGRPGRSAHRHHERQRRSRPRGRRRAHRQRAASAWASGCSPPTRRRSMPRSAASRSSGNVEYLDPTLHVRGQGGSFADGNGEFEGAKFELLDGSGPRRGDERAACATRRRSTSRACATRPARPATTTGSCAPTASRSTRRRSIGTGRDVRLDFKGVADPLHAVDLVPGRRPAQVRPAVSRDRQRRQDRHADRRAVVLEHRAELRRDVHVALLLVAGLSHRPRVPLPDRAQPRHARRRVPAARPRTRATRAACSRSATRHALRAAHAALVDAAYVTRQLATSRTSASASRAPASSS